MSKQFEPEMVLETLERLAKSHDSKSEEYISIELAAKAILFVHASGQRDAFRAYLDSFGQELTDEQKKVLAAMGLE